jgi:hypothetical protein
MTDHKRFVFDWAAQTEGFLKWFVPTVIAEIADAPFKELGERTSAWSDVQVQILINGIEVNAGHFLESVERNMEHHAKQAAREMLDEVGGLDALEERIGEIRTHLMGQFEAALRERGIELPEREW